MNTFDSYPRMQPYPHLGSMPEEEEIDHGSDSFRENSPQEWNFHGEMIRYSSPSASIRSYQSSPSEIGGDSGVCSEHDTPPPKARKHLSRRTTVSSDSDNDSSASSENHESHKECQQALRQDLIRVKNSTRKKTSCRGSSQSKLPDCLLREIKEKSRELKRRRQIFRGDAGDRISFSRTSSFQRSGSLSRLCFSSNSIPQEFSTLSLADSSRYSSSTSLSTEEDDYFQTTYTKDYSKSLYECKDDSAGSGFAGINTIFAPQQESTIRSYKGTVRGVKNRVRAGIATFTLDHSFLKLYAEREKGKVVIYITTLGVVRDTFERCLRLRKILWTLLVHFEERDVFMSRDTQIQLLDRLHSRTVSVPHVFLEGQYLGGVELIEKLNETGELRRLLQPYMRPASITPCDTCGGFHFLPCSVCRGSKKSVHRNHFTLEFVALKCSACDESGLVPCHECQMSFQ